MRTVFVVTAVDGREEGDYEIFSDRTRADRYFEDQRDEATPDDTITLWRYSTENYDAQDLEREIDDLWCAGLPLGTVVRTFPHGQSGDWSEREWAAARAMRIEETRDSLPPGFAARQWDSGTFGDPQKYLRMARAALQAADAVKKEGAATVTPLEGDRQYTLPVGTEVKK